MLAADITQTTAQDLSAFLNAGLKAGLAPSTLNTKLSTYSPVPNAAVPTSFAP